MPSVWGSSWGSSWGSAWGPLTTPTAPTSKPPGKTYLELCQKLRLETSSAGTGPATVVNQTGLLSRLVTWVSDAYRDIQLRHTYWRWMKSDFSINTGANVDTYPFWSCLDTNDAGLITRFTNWWPHDAWEPFKIYRLSDGITSQQYLIYMDWQRFKQIYKFGSQQVQTGQPIHVSIDDQDQIVLGPKPDGIYVVTGTYQRGPQILVNDDDIPDMPIQFHDLIVYYAMERYASHAIAGEVLARATLEGGRLMRALEQNQLPRIRMGAPLA